MAFDLSKISAGDYEVLLKSLDKEHFDLYSDAILLLFSPRYPFGDESWPLDLAMFSRDKSMREGIDAVFYDIRHNRERAKQKPGKLFRALNVVLTNLIYRHISAPGYYIRLSRGKSDYKLKSRYNPNKIGYDSMMGAIAGLEDCGYFEMILG
ncbi:MAG: hypothetical protein VB959_12670, partial [Rhodospirillales bacterium]